MLKTMSAADWRAEFRSWVEKQPKEREYNFSSYDNCAVGLYMNEVLHESFYGQHCKGGGIEYNPIVHATHGTTDGVTLLAYGGQTFGELAARMRVSPLYN